MIGDLTYTELYAHATTLERKLTERGKLLVMLREALIESCRALEYRWETVANRAAPIHETEIDAAYKKAKNALATIDMKGCILCVYGEASGGLTCYALEA